VGRKRQWYFIQGPAFDLVGDFAAEAGPGALRHDDLGFGEGVMNNVSETVRSVY
jgi:hypothetical protein